MRKFIVATHVDKAHIHNHIIYNSTTLDCFHKFRNFLFCGIALQRVSDLVCLEHGCSVIKPRKPGEREKRTVYPNRKSIRDKIREEDFEKVFKGEESFNPPPREKQSHRHEKPKKKFDMLLDIQDIISKGKGPGYERWAKVAATVGLVLHGNA